MSLIRKVIESNNGQKRVTIPKNSDIDGGDYVTIETVEGVDEDA
jgi:hypothetical protein